MSQFSFIPIFPHPILRPYIAKMYVFKSNGRLPVMDNKLIVPNANFKLTYTWLNGIVAKIGDKTFDQSENQISLSGLIDRPVLLDPKKDSRTGTIIIEFNPFGAYRFFHLSFTELKNQIIELSDLFGNHVNEIQTQLTNSNSLKQKVDLLQIFLIKQLDKTSPDPIFDYCIKRILVAKGVVTVAKLEKETGYSSRWLHTKFTEHLGSGPKNLAEIVRFKQFYKTYSTGIDIHQFKDQIYQYYHDQSHFIRAFKRFTGFTLTDLQNSTNELATKHYTS